MRQHGRPRSARRFTVRQALYSGFCVATCLLLSGCVWLPHTAAHYNEDCDFVQKKMTLESYQVASIAACSNEGCAALLAAAGAVSAATAVVSGSVVLVGNVVYWLEEKRQCFN